jgi:hypothetical protein
MRNVAGPRGASVLVVFALAMATSLMASAADGNGRLYPAELPPGPAKPGFELARFNPEANGIFEPFRVDDTHLLHEALAAGLVAEDTKLLVLEIDGETLGLLTEQMAYHHIAQGRTAGVEWMATFCVVCNTGSRLAASVEGRRHSFTTVGLYDGVMVMQDVETKTIWHHITGEALYGPLVGRTLGPVGNLLHMNVRQVLARNRQAQIAISDRVYVARGRQLGFLSGVGPGTGALSLPSDWRRDLRLAQAAGEPLPGKLEAPRGPDAQATLHEMFAVTLGAEDMRRPRMELGLGIWTGTTSRFYPMARIREDGGAFIDTLDGRRVLVYIDPGTSTPTALFVDSRQAELKKRRIQLDNGHYVEDGVLIGPRGQRLPEERPRQLFTRWYGFALTFPDSEVFGQE